MVCLLPLSSTQDTATLEQLIVEDRSHGKIPLFVLGTAGRSGRVELMDPVIMYIAHFCTVVCV